MSSWFDFRSNSDTTLTPWTFSFFGSLDGLACIIFLLMKLWDYNQTLKCETLTLRKIKTKIKCAFLWLRSQRCLWSLFGVWRVPKKSQFYSFLFWWVKMRRQENSFLSMLVGKIYPASGICFLCLTTSGTHQLWERRSTYPMQGIPSPANVTLNK